MSDQRSVKNDFNKPMFAFYSAKSAALNGYVIYKDIETGKEIKVTFVCEEENPKQYDWEDTVLVGKTNINNFVKSTKSESVGSFFRNALPFK